MLDKKIVHWQDVSDFLEKSFPRWFNVYELSKKFGVQFKVIQGKLIKMKKRDLIESKSIFTDKYHKSKKVYRFKRVI